MRLVFVLCQRCGIVTLRDPNSGFQLNLSGGTPPCPNCKEPFPMVVGEMETETGMSSERGPSK